MFGEKKYTVLATIAIGLAILSAVGVPALIAGNTAAAQGISTSSSTATLPYQQGSSSVTDQMQTTQQTQDQGNVKSTSTHVDDDHNHSFTSSVKISPTADSNAKVTIQGTGLTAKQMNVNQERLGDGRVKITVEGIFAVQSSGGGKAAEEGEAASSTSTTTTTTPMTPSGNETGQTTTSKVPSGNETSTATTGTRSGSITLTPTSGKAGNTVTIKGTGFSAGQAFSLTFDGTPLLTSDMTQSASGDFTTVATIPANAPSGEHEIKATDGIGESATAKFTVVGEASGNVTASPIAPSQGGSNNETATSTTAGNETASGTMTTPSGNETSAATSTNATGNATSSSASTTTSGNATSTTTTPSGNQTSTTGNETSSSTTPSTTGNETSTNATATVTPPTPLPPSGNETSPTTGNATQ